MITLLIATRNAHKLQEMSAILGERFWCVSLTELPGAPEVAEDAGTFAGNATKKAVALAKWVAGQRVEAKVQISKPSVQSPSATVQGPKFEISSAPADRSEEGEIFVLADDSGLEVDALNGAPGVHSARFAALDKGTGDNSPPDQNNAKLLRLLQAVPAQHRTARFRCVLALTPLLEPAGETASAVCGADEFELQTEIFEGACEGRIGAAPKGEQGFGYDPLFFPAGYEQTFGELGEEVKNRLSHRARALARLKEWFSERGRAEPRQG